MLSSHPLVGVALCIHGSLPYAEFVLPASPDWELVCADIFLPQPEPPLRVVSAYLHPSANRELAWDFIVPLLKTGSTLMLGDFNSQEGSQLHTRLQSLVAKNIARDVFPASATFRRGALVESILDDALFSSQTRYSLEAHGGARR